MAEIVSLERTADALITQKAHQSSHHDQLAQSKVRAERQLRSQLFRIKELTMTIHQKEGRLVEAKEDHSRATADAERLALRLRALFVVQDEAMKQGRVEQEQSTSHHKTLTELPDLAMNALRKIRSARELVTTQQDLLTKCGKVEALAEIWTQIVHVRRFQGQLEAFVSHQQQSVNAIATEVEEKKKLEGQRAQELLQLQSNLEVSLQQREEVEKMCTNSKERVKNLEVRVAEMEAVITKKQENNQHLRAQLEIATTVGDQLAGKEAESDKILEENMKKTATQRQAVAAAQQGVEEYAAAVRRKEVDLKGQLAATTTTALQIATMLNETLLSAYSKAKKVDSVAQLYVGTKSTVMEQTAAVATAEQRLELELSKEKETNARVEEHRRKTQFNEEQDAKFTAEVRRLDQEVVRVVQQDLLQAEHDAFSNLLGRHRVEVNAVWTKTVEMPQQQSAEWTSLLELEGNQHHTLSIYLEEKIVAINTGDRWEQEEAEGRDRGVIEVGEAEDFKELQSVFTQQAEALAQARQQQLQREEDVRRAQLLKRLKEQHPTTQEERKGELGVAGAGGATTASPSTRAKKAAAVAGGLTKSRITKTRDGVEKPKATPKKRARDVEDHPIATPPKQAAPTAHDGTLTAALTGAKRRHLVFKAEAASQSASESGWSAMSNIVPIQRPIPPRSGALNLFKAEPPSSSFGPGGCSQTATQREAAAAAVGRGVSGHEENGGNWSDGATLADLLGNNGVRKATTTVGRTSGRTVVETKAAASSVVPRPSPDPSNPYPSSQRFQASVLIANTKAIASSGKELDGDPSSPPKRGGVRTTVAKPVSTPQRLVDAVRPSTKTPAKATMKVGKSAGGAMLSMSSMQDRRQVPSSHFTQAWLHTAVATPGGKDSDIPLPATDTPLPLSQGSTVQPGIGTTPATSSAAKPKPRTKKAAVASSGTAQGAVRNTNDDDMFLTPPSNPHRTTTRRQPPPKASMATPTFASGGGLASMLTPAHRRSGPTGRGGATPSSSAGKGGLGRESTAPQMTLKDLF